MEKSDDGCILDLANPGGGKTRMTITSIERPNEPVVWQLGGELAEQWAETTGPAFFPDQVGRPQKPLIIC